MQGLSTFKWISKLRREVVLSSTNFIQQTNIGCVKKGDTHKKVNKVLNPSYIYTKFGLKHTYSISITHMVFSSFSVKLKNLYVVLNKNVNIESQRNEKTH